MSLRELRAEAQKIKDPCLKRLVECFLVEMTLSEKEVEFGKSLESAAKRALGGKS